MSSVLKVPRICHASLKVFLPKYVVWRVLLIYLGLPHHVSSYADCLGVCFFSLWVCKLRGHFNAMVLESAVHSGDAALEWCLHLSRQFAYIYRLQSSLPHLNNRPPRGGSAASKKQPWESPRVAEVVWKTSLMLDRTDSNCPEGCTCNCRLQPLSSYICQGTYKRLVHTDPIELCSHNCIKQQLTDPHGNNSGVS